MSKYGRPTLIFGNELLHEYVVADNPIRKPLTTSPKWIEREVGEDSYKWNKIEKKEISIDVYYSPLKGEAQGLFDLKLSSLLYSNKPQKIIFDDRPGFYDVGVISSIERDLIVFANKYTLTFQCYPFSYGEDQLVKFEKGEYEKTFYNPGEYFSYPEISFKPSDSRCEIWNKHDPDKKNSIETTVSGVNFELVLDNEKGKITSKSGQGYSEFLTLKHRWIKVFPGMNTIKRSFDGEMLVKFTPRWIG